MKVEIIEAYKNNFTEQGVIEEILEDLNWAVGYKGMKDEDFPKQFKIIISVEELK